MSPIKLPPRWPPALGWPGLGAALALAAAVPLALLAPHWAQQAQQARQSRAALPPPPPAAPVAAEPVLPPAGEPAERVADLLELALRHGITVERTQQRQDSTPGVTRLVLGLGVKGRYVDLRDYVADALAADPALSLERLQMRRANATANELDAELQWSLLAPPPAAEGPRT